MQAQLTSDKSKLVGNARLENRQEFVTVPTLGELGYFLQVISKELTIYRVWPVREVYAKHPTVSWP